MSRRAGALAAAAATTAAVQMPFDAAYGIIALAPLGPALAGAGVAGALLGSVAALLLATAAGSRHLVLGPRPASALLMAGLATSLLAQPATRLANGQPNLPLVIALMALAVAGSGLLQALLGALRFGSLARMVSYPVRAGFLNAVAVLMILGGLRMVWGQPVDMAFSHGWASPGPPRWGAVAVGAVALAATLWPPRWGRRRLPGPLAGVLAGMAAHFALQRWGATHFPGMTGMLSGSVSVTSGSAIDFGLWWTGWHALADGTLAALWPLLATLAASVVLLSSLDTLVVSSVMDGIARTRRDGNRELLVQGLGNVAAALVGGQPIAPALGRSMLMWQAGGRGPEAMLLYAALVAGVVLVVPQLLGLIPLAAVGATLIVTGAQLVDDWTRRAPGLLWRSLRAGRAGAMPVSPVTPVNPATPGTLRNASPTARGFTLPQTRTLVENLAVMLGVAAAGVLLGLAPAVGLGVVVALLLFARRHARPIVRRHGWLDTRHSIKVRPADVARRLAVLSHRVAVLELEGTLFFGTADELSDELLRVEPVAVGGVLGFKRVTDIDSTGARVLLDTAGAWAAQGKWLVLSDLPEGGAWRQTLAAMGLDAAAARAAGLHFEPDLDRALQWAEDRLLAVDGSAPGAVQALSLADTVLGRGLSAAELALLAPRMSEQQLAAGQRLFSAGDAGDALYLTRHGEVGIYLPAGDGGPVPGVGRRLVSFAPGTMVGELALLENERRSAHALAESDLTVWRLSRDDFDALLRSEPQLAARLLRNMARHVASRLRALTQDLQAEIEA